MVLCDPCERLFDPKRSLDSQVENHSSKGSIPPLLTILANIAAGIGDKVMFSQLQSVLHLDCGLAESPGP